MDISLNGTAYKYTNFVYGYQERYFKLKNGGLSYYLSKESDSEGPRKHYTLTNFSLEYAPDLFHLDIVFPDERWSLRFRNEREYNTWKNALEAFIPNRCELAPFFSDSSSTCVSVASDLSSDASTTCSSSPISQQDFVTLCNVKNSASNRFSTIMLALDKITTQMSASESRLNLGRVCLVNLPENVAQIKLALTNCRNLKKEIVYLRNVLQSMTEKIEAHQQLFSNSVSTTNRPGMMSTSTTGSNGATEVTSLSQQASTSNMAGGGSRASTQNDDDEVWADALDDGAEAVETTVSEVVESGDGTEIVTVTEVKSSLVPSHLFVKNQLFHEIERVTSEQLQHAMAPVDGGAGWELFYTDGEMKMYRMESEGDDGIACDPLKALHSVKGISAREYIDTFFNPTLKKLWDDTLVDTKVVEELHEHTVVIHQLHKRVWPSAQRESLFWSQRVDVTAHREPGALDAFLVCNYSTERQDVTLPSSNVRVKLKIAMLCQTYVAGGDVKNVDKTKLNRDDIFCKITYVAQIHPGGWVPAAGVRQVAKREYPKFLRQFTRFVEKSVKNSPLKM